jgi:hypothetical protein
MLSSSSQAEKNNIKKKKFQRREGVYLSSLASAFGMKNSPCVELPTFFKPCVVKLCATQDQELY